VSECHQHIDDYACTASWFARGEYQANAGCYET
jgi:hypothetical protein